MVNLRTARPEELDPAAEVIVRAYLQYEELMPPAVWASYVHNIADVRSRLAEAELIVAEEHERILGCVTFYPEGPQSQQGWPADHAAIRLLAVHPEARGIGLGHALTQECIRRSGELGRHYVGLHTIEFMAIAKAMYERIGFQRMPEFDFTPGPGLVVMAYRLDLSPGGSSRQAIS